MKPALALLLTLTAALTVNAADAPAAKFTRAWTLDKAASTNLPPHLQKVRDWRLDVSGDAAALHVKVTIVPADGETLVSDFHYRLDGQPSPVSLPVRTPAGPKRIEGVANARVDGDAILITVTSERPTPNGPVQVTSEERWTIANGALSVQRKDPTPNGTVDYTMIFN